MTIPIFRPRFHVDECLAEIRECLDKGWTGLGFKTVQFEDAWKSYTGLAHAHFLNSATAGLHLAINIFKNTLDWQEGDEIISTPITFVSSNHAILYENLKPVFADVDEYLCLDPDDVERKITERARAVMFVGVGGNAGQLKRIAEICRTRGLKLILDAAHMSGARLDGADPGRLADAAVYSFQAVKNLPTADSGMLCLKDGELDALARRQSWLGISKDTYQRAKDPGAYSWMYDVDTVGFKYHGNSIMAAIGLVQLKYLDRDNEFRRQVAGWYDAAFAGANAVTPVPVAPGCVSSRHFYQVEVADRAAVIKALNDADVHPGVHYRDNTEYPMYAHARGTCPNAHRLSERVLSLPMHLALTRDDVETVARAVLDAAE
jgi:dTDP-4-amino-4,6-dideoxygalactose transaminase